MIYATYLFDIVCQRGVSEIFTGSKSTTAMHEPIADFETVTPDLWLANEQAWIERLLKLPNWHRVRNQYIY